MTVNAWVALAVAAALAAVGVVSLARSFGNTRPEDPGRVRVLIVAHDVARSGFWFGLAGFFVAYALSDDPVGARGILVVPLVLAGVRLLTAQSLSRRL